jgi:hypothetical protein
MAGDEGATAQAIGKVLRLDKSAAWRRLNAAQTEGFIRNLEVRRGQPGRYRATGQEVEAAVILPSPAELEASPPAPLSKMGQPCNRTEKVEYSEEDDGCKADCNRAHPPAPPEPVADGCRAVATPFATAKSLNDTGELLPVARLPENLKEAEGMSAEDDRVCAQCGAGGTDLDHHDQAGDVWLHPECVRFWKSEHDDDLTIPNWLNRNQPAPS